MKALYWTEVALRQLGMAVLLTRKRALEIYNCPLRTAYSQIHKDC